MKPEIIAKFSFNEFQTSRVKSFYQIFIALYFIMKTKVGSLKKSF